MAREGEAAEQAKTVGRASSAALANEPCGSRMAHMARSVCIGAEVQEGDEGGSETMGKEVGGEGVDGMAAGDVGGGKETWWE